MRRMIPQSFADWIKKIKNKLFVNNDGDVEVDGELVVDGTTTSTAKIYQHYVTLYCATAGKSFAFSLNIVNSSDTPYTKDTLLSWIVGLYNKFGSANTIIPCSGTIEGMSNVAYWYVERVGANYNSLMIGFDTSFTYSQSITKNLATLFQDAQVLKDMVIECQ